MIDNQKIRPLAIYQLLKNHTDSSVVLGTFEIAQTLNLEGLPTSIKEVKEDVKLLKEWGFGICEVKGEDAYYVSNKIFSDDELCSLIDAIESTTSITESKATELINKLARLAGFGSAESFKKRTGFDSK